MLALENAWDNNPPRSPHPARPSLTRLPIERAVMSLQRSRHRNKPSRTRRCTINDSPRGKNTSQPRLRQPSSSGVLEVKMEGSRVPRVDLLRRPCRGCLQLRVDPGPAADGCKSASGRQCVTVEPARQAANRHPIEELLLSGGLCAAKGVDIARLAREDCRTQHTGGPYGSNEHSAP